MMTAHTLASMWQADWSLFVGTEATCEADGRCRTLPEYLILRKHFLQAKRFAKMTFQKLSRAEAEVGILRILTLFFPHL